MSETVTKKEPGMAQLVIVLFAICAVVALLLGLVNMITAPAIAANTAKKTAEAKAAVLAADSYDDVVYTGSDPVVKGIWKARDAGYVVEVTPSGFGGNLDVMVGVDKSGTCTGVSIISHAETSGLGANSVKPDFRAQFVGKGGTVQVSKDGGEIQALTGATITSRAVCAGVTSAIAAAKSMG